MAALLFAATVYAALYDTFWWPPDEGAYAHVADRILAGETLNGDVQDVHLGYINFANAAALWLFGGDLVSLRYPLVVMGVVQSAVIFLMFLPSGLATALAASAGMTTLTTVQFLNPSAHWYCLFIFVAVVAALEWIPKEHRRRVPLIGFLLITLFLFRQLTGILVGIGVTAWLLLERSEEDTRRRDLLATALMAVMAVGLAGYLVGKTNGIAWLFFGIGPLAVLAWGCRNVRIGDRATARLAAGLSLGGAAAFVPLFLYHLINGSLATWFDDTVLSALALTNLGFFDDASYAILPIAGIRQIFVSPSITAIANGVFWLAVPLLASACGFLLIRALLRGGTPANSIHPLPFLAVFYAVVSVHYQIPIYLFYTAAVSLAGLLYLSGDSRAARLSAVALAGFLSVVGLWFHAGQPLTRGLAATIAGERSAMPVPCNIDRCGLRVTSEDAAIYSGIAALIEREVASDEAILALPVNPELYYLTGRRNPLRFYNSALGIRRNQDLEQAIATLRSDPPRLVFHRPEDKYNTAYSARIMEMVRTEYDLLERRDGFDVYRAPAAVRLQERAAR